MYKVYSFEKKIFILLKICKFIYDFMVIGNLGRELRGGAGRGYGVCDFFYLGRWSFWKY